MIDLFFAVMGIVSGALILPFLAFVYFKDKRIDRVDNWFIALAIISLAAQNLASSARYFSGVI